MGRWQPLPDDLSAQRRRLTEELRLHKDRSGLSLASLAAKTAYSATSWQRYLSGQAMPPWQAVDLLGRLVEADRATLRVLWESAVSGENAAPPVDDTAAQGHRRRAPRTTAIVVVAGALLTVLTLGYVWSGGSHARPVPRGAPGDAPVWPWPLRSAGAVSALTDCQGHRCQGRDPYREGCDRDATVVHALRAYGGLVTLRYSRVCRAVWAQTDPVRGTARLLVAGPGVMVLTARSGASRTPMVSAVPDTARACVVRASHQLCVTSRESWADPVTVGTPRG
ncbi:helix-turn-helix domain-containing protein [Streptomyces kaempferi]